MSRLRGTIGYRYDVEGPGGYHWIFYEDGYMLGDDFTGYMHRINEGDSLKVFSMSGEVLFDGVIDPDDTINFSTPWIPWVQRGWVPNDWINLFFNSLIDSTNSMPLRAELVKKG